VELSTPTSSPNCRTTPRCTPGCSSTKLVPATLRSFQRLCQNPFRRVRLLWRTLRPSNLRQSRVQSLNCYAASSRHQSRERRAPRRGKRSSLPRLCQPSLRRISAPRRNALQFGWPLFLRPLRGTRSYRSLRSRQELNHLRALQ
jgi:hypothetical protein